VLVLVLVFAGIFSSADEPPLTLQQYAQQNPVGFVTTAMGGLSGTGAVGGIPALVGLIWSRKPASR